MDPWSAIAIVGGLIVQVFIPGFPKETLLLQAGISYGTILGTLVNWLGMVLGAQIGYEIARYSFLTGGKLFEQVDSYTESEWFYRLQDQGNPGLFFLRLIPYAPNDILSILSGFLLLPRRGFFLVSILTAFPYALIFAYAGDLGSHYFGRETLIMFNIILMISSLFVVFMIHLYRSYSKNTTKFNEV